MDTADLHDLVGDLTSQIDDLEATLAPLTQKPLTTTSSKLPLLDKAKLHVLATYTLESILFNSLRLNGTDAKSHPVFAELNRVKEYFGKIKTAEGTSAKPSSRVDKEAAGRFIKAGLAGNDRFDREREERSARERTGAKRKLGELGGGAAKRIKFDDEGKAMESGLSARDDSEVDDGEGGVALSSSGTEKKKAEKRARRQKAKEAKLSPHGASEGRAQADDAEPVENDQPSGKSSKPPKSTREALDSLLDGASSKLEKKSKKRKKNKVQALEDERADEMK